jgi:hypothetical protein
LTLPGDDAGDVFFLVVFSPDQVLAALYSENNMGVNLCVGVGMIYATLMELIAFFFRGNYKDLAPTEHALALEMSKLRLLD